MKPPSKLLKKNKKPAPPPLIDQLEEYRSQIIDLGQEVELLRKQVKEELGGLVRDAGDETKNYIIGVAREHFNARQDDIIRHMFGFFKLDLLWEHEMIWGSSVTSAKARELVSRGYSYVHHIYEPDAKDVTQRHGELYRRPKLPKTFDEFKKLYWDYVKADKATRLKAKKDAEDRAAAAIRVDEEVARALRKKNKVKKLAKTEE